MAIATTKRICQQALSVVDLFTIGIGPSSSHTVGPMRAALQFSELLARKTDAHREVQLHLYGSLALTGRGHATDIAVLIGLSGWKPEEIEPADIPVIADRIRNTRRVVTREGHVLPFDTEKDIYWHKEVFLPEHPNAMTLSATTTAGETISRRYYSIGGGAVIEENAAPAFPDVRLQYPFSSAADLLNIANRHHLRIDELVLANEAAWREQDETFYFLDTIRAAMSDCIERGCRETGTLPGGLRVPRRARAIRESLQAATQQPDAAAVFDWVSLWALAVNEENAAGGRVVTAPTNGAAGVIPAVLRYYATFVHGATDGGERRFLLAASAIGFLYKTRASISAAEMGCQGEVGVACSMAAAGLTAALGGTNEQVENAAEIGMEHNLGLTCDPIAGLVQIPCIERNTMGAIKAINAARLALHGDGSHVVSLDAVIETMRQTGEDMRSKYKETSLGGLAVNVVEC
jgi:L-serine dehydratase